MRASTLAVIVSLGLSIGVADVGCTSHSAEGFRTPPETRAVGLVYPANHEMQKYGIADWRVYLGKAQMVVTGYSEAGHPVSGYQLAAFKQSGVTPAHLRLTMLDGSGFQLRRYADGHAAFPHRLSVMQTEVLLQSVVDLRHGSSSAGLGEFAAGSTGSIRLQGLPSATTGIHPLVTNSGLACFDATAASVAATVGAGILGAGTVGACAITGLLAVGVPLSAGLTALGGAGTLGLCTAGITATPAAFKGAQTLADQATTQCSQPCAACAAATTPTKTFGGASSLLKTLGESSVTSSVGILDENSGTSCPLANAGGEAEAGAGSDEAGAGTGDGGASGSSDDASATGDDGGSGDDGGASDPTDDGGSAVPAGDDGGGGTDQDPQDTTDNEKAIDQMADNTTCDSCPNQTDGSNLTVDPSNGDVTVGSTTDDPTQTAPSTSPTADPGANAPPPAEPGGSSGGGGGSGGIASQDSSSQDSSSQDSSSQDSSSQDSSSQDAASQDTGSQDTASQDTGSQDTGSQDTGSQDTGSQDTGSQDTGSQDTGSQDTQDTATQDSQDTGSARRHHSHARTSAWRRIYDWITNVVR